MTQFERDEQVRLLNERMFALAHTMSESDAHASKCVKLGLSFKETYPEEYTMYCTARKEYNECEMRLKELENMEVEEVFNEANIVSNEQ